MDRIASVASSLFVIGNDRTRGNVRSSHAEQERRRSSSQQREATRDTLSLSRTATIGRNSDFRNLTSEDYERLGGIEYRALKLLLKIVTGYFFGLHLFGAISLVGWILHADPKYRDYLAECGQGSVWW